MARHRFLTPGARREPRTPIRRRLLACVATAVVGMLLAAGGLRAQEPPDTVQVSDSVAVADSAAAADSLAAQADSVSADTIFYNLPELQGAPPAGWERGVWVWNHEDIMASGANTLVELVADVAGLVPLRGGDYGTPIGLTAFGAAGGAVRVLRDGVEVTPLAAGVPDLQRIGLGGIHQVRLERGPGELVFHLESLRYDDGRPYSLVEAGTGDLDTNIFRGTFANPTALGGSMALALERTDTRGPRGDEAGNRNGAWVRYQLHRGDQAGVSVDFRRMSTETEVEDYAAASTRTDWSVRGRARLATGLTGEAYWATSAYELDDPREVYAGEGGSRSQLGARLAWARDGVYLRSAYRRFGGEALPGDRLELRGGARIGPLGGVTAGWERSGWDGRSASSLRVGAWTAPLLGFSLFASRASGTWGARSGPLMDAPVETPDTAGETTPTTLSAAQEEEPQEPPPLFRVVDRTATRYGAQWAWGGVALSGARLEVEADSLLPSGLEFDRAEPALAGGTRSGWEAWGRLPLPILDGLHAEGSLQQWEEGWPYLPKRIYRGALVYHKTFMESGNLELDWSLGVRGRSPMGVRILTEVQDEETGETLSVPDSVPFYQSWYGTIQVRVVTVRIFIGWDNFTIRRNLQDIPGRVLPATRAFYGIRWTLWN